MLAKKKLQLMEDMWRTLFSVKGDQVEEARTKSSMCIEYFLV
jgi:hypothetical protein